MKTLKVIVCKTGSGVSAHIEDVNGFVIARNSVHHLKKDLPEGLNFHIEGLYEEEREPWMNGEYTFEYVFQDITLQRIESGLKRYADELQSVSFEYA